MLTKGFSQQQLISFQPLGDTPSIIHEHPYLTDPACSSQHHPNESPKAAHLQLPLTLLPLLAPPLLGLPPPLRHLGDVTPLVHDLQPLLVAQGERVADPAALSLIAPRRELSAADVVTTWLSSSPICTQSGTSFSSRRRLENLITLKSSKLPKPEIRE
jgi:hypothetical protein